MQVGKLRHRITFQRKAVSGKASSGQDIYTWSDFSPSIIRTASIKPIKGQEGVEARAVYNQSLVSIMVRFDPEVATVTAADRIIQTDDNSRIYAIHNIMNHEEQDRWVEFWVSEGLQDKH